MKLLRFTFLILLCASACFAQEIKRPTTDSDGGNNTKLGCTGINSGSGVMPLGYDTAGVTTNSQLAVTGSQTQTKYKTRIFGGWQNANNTYTALSLTVVSAGTETTSGSVGKICAKYSTDGGTTWTQMYCRAPGQFNQSTFIVSGLDQTLSLSSFRVGVCVQGQAGGDTQGSTDTIFVYDIYTTGTYTTADQSGNGSSAGNAHRGSVTVN